jgi:hypothetical protein
MSLITTTNLNTTNTRNYIGELYILDKIKSDSIISQLFTNHETILEDLYSKYINKIYLYYLLNTCVGDYSTVYSKLVNIIKYRCKYNLLLNNKCLLCSNNTPVHSITYRGFDCAGYHIIYIEPACATDFTISYVCQHLLMCFDEVINIIIMDLYSNNKIVFKEKHEHQEKIKLVFNMKNNTNSLRNIKIAKAMYNIINECYINDIVKIQVHNFGSFMKFFTKLFTKSFNKKIICI